MCIRDSTNTMQFCGYIAAEVKNKSLKAIFEHIDSSKVGSFTLYDRNGIPIYSTDPSYGQGTDVYKRQAVNLTWP